MAKAKRISVEREDDRDFFAALGRCVAGWAEIGRLLFEFCKFALETDNERTAVVFYRAPSLGPHLELTCDLMKRALKDGVHMSKWAEIKKEASHLLPLRNAIAHNPTVLRMQYSDDRARFFWASMTEGTTGLRSKKPRVKYTSKQLEQHLRTLSALREKMRELLRELGTARP